MIVEINVSLQRYRSWLFSSGHLSQAYQLSCRVNITFYIASFKIITTSPRSINKCERTSRCTNTSLTRSTDCSRRRCIDIFQRSYIRTVQRNSTTLGIVFNFIFILTIRTIDQFNITANVIKRNNT